MQTMQAELSASWNNSSGHALHMLQKTIPLFEKLCDPDLREGDIVTLHPHLSPHTKRRLPLYMDGHEFEIISLVDDKKIVISDGDLNFPWFKAAIATCNGFNVSWAFKRDAEPVELEIDDTEQEAGLPRTVVDVGRVAVWNKEAYYSHTSNGRWRPVPPGERDSIRKGALVKPRESNWAYRFERFSRDGTEVVTRYDKYPCFRFSFPISELLIKY